MTDEIPELTSKDFEYAITREQRLRLISGEWKAGDLAVLRKYLGLSQKQFALRIGIVFNRDKRPNPMLYLGWRNRYKR